MLNTLTLFCSLIITIHLIYYLFVFKLYRYKEKKHQVQTTKTPISVIVCGKNEEDNFKKLIPKLLNQNYSDFEIILINDRSYDNTADIINQFADNHQNIKTVHVKEADYFISKKKYALTLGIKAATHDCLLFTDADCIPNDDFWIESMVNHFYSKKQIVLGYSPYKKISNSFLNKIIRYETLITAIQYLSYALCKSPYMGVGRNLMYSKQLFFKHNGFSTHMQIMSGDDDLFVNQTANKQNTAISIDSKSFMISEPKTTLRSLIKQKRRHISTASHYKNKHKFALGLYALNRVLFWVFFPLSFILIKDHTNLLYLTGLISIKFLVEYIVVGIAAKKLKEKKLILLTPLLDFSLLLLQLYIFICNLFIKPKNWS